MSFLFSNLSNTKKQELQIFCIKKKLDFTGTEVAFTSRIFLLKEKIDIILFRFEHHRSGYAEHRSYSPGESVGPGGNEQPAAAADERDGDNNHRAADHSHGTGGDRLPSDSAARRHTSPQ